MTTRSAHAVRPLVLLAATGLPALALAFLPAPDTRLQLFSALGPAIVLGSVLVALAWLLAGARFRRTEPADPQRARAPTGAGFAAIAVLAVAVAVIAQVVPARMRVQADEYLIAGTALGIAQEGVPLVVAAGYAEDDGRIAPTLAMFDKRGIFYSAAWGLVDRVRGFRIADGYALNLILGWTALVALYLLLRVYLTPALALSGALLFAAQPLFAWSIRSIALEPGNLALLAAAGAVGLRAVRDRDVRLAHALLWLAPLAAQARYESILLSLVALPMGWAVLAGAPLTRAGTVSLLALPIAYLPSVWQRALPTDFQLTQAHTDHAFGFDHLSRHASNLGQLLGTVDEVNALGIVPLLVVALGLGAWAYRSRGVRMPGTPLAVATLAVVAVPVAIGVFLLSFAWGDPGQPTTTRLILPWLLLLCAAVPTAWKQLLPVPIAAPTALVASFAAFAIGVPAMRADSLQDGLVPGPALNAARAWLGDAMPGCRVLVVSEASPYFLVHGIGALTPPQLATTWPEVLRRASAGNIDGVVRVHVVDRVLGVEVDGKSVPEGYVETPMMEQVVNRHALVRLGRIDAPAAPLVATARPACAWNTGVR